jgi:hypothetical protein
MGLPKSGDAASRFSAYVEGLAIRRRLKRRMQKLPRCLVGIEKRSNGTSGMQSSRHPQGRQPRARLAPSARMSTECSGDNLRSRGADFS